MPRTPSKRHSLSRARVLAAAVKMTDQGGIEALSMRKLGRRLGVEAMSLYNFVNDKDDLIDGMIDSVVSEIEVPPIVDGDWRAALAGRARSARHVLVQHPWAAALIESRVTSGPAKLRYLEAILEVLHAAGFSTANAHRAILSLDSHIYGFVLQEVSWPNMQSMPDQAADKFAELPRLAAIAEHVFRRGIDVDAWFDYGLDVILDGLEKLRAESHEAR